MLKKRKITYKITTFNLITNDGVEMGIQSTVVFAVLGSGTKTSRSDSKG